MDKTILTLAAIIILLGGIAAFVTLRGSDEPAETTDEIEIVFADGTRDTISDEDELVEEEETAVEEEETAEEGEDADTSEEDSDADSEEADDESTESDEEAEDSDSADEDKESESETDSEDETTDTEKEEVVATPEDDWETTFEYTTTDTEELYRVRVADETSTDSDGNTVTAAAIEYAASADDDFSSIEGLNLTVPASTSFSMDDAGYSFLTLTKTGGGAGQYFLINKNGQNVYPLMPSSTYYYVYGGLGGKIFVVQSQVSGDGGLYLNYYNDEKEECALYTEQPVQGDSVEMVGTEAVFTIDANAEENAGEEVTLDYVEVCEL